MKQPNSRDHDNDDFYTGPSQDCAIKTIQNFLGANGACGGGVLLVAGQRGIGKTRLVDQALNGRREKKCWTELRKRFEESTGLSNRLRILFSAWACPLAPLIAWLFNPFAGRDPWRFRLEVTRSPRGVRRLIIPVHVDPFFPGRRSRKKTDDTSSPADVDADVLTLIHNLVFALTSEIDARHCTRSFGRTLSNRLGWLNLWITPTALTRPNGHPARGWAWLSAFAAFPAGMALGTLPQALFFSEAPVIPSLCHQLSILLWPAASMTPLAPPLAWCILRALDLRAVRAMGSQLYDLVHAQTMRKRVQSKIEAKLHFAAKQRRLSAILLGGISLLTGAAFQITEIDAHELSMVILALGAASLLWGITRDVQRHTTFGNDNHAWMVTLLRRYLFLLHRAGLEPVLVLDELDKLSRPPPSNLPVTDETSPPHFEFDRFERAMWRIKQSLGAEFVWILIDTDEMIERVLQGRANVMGYGRSGTLVQKEVVLGPLPYSEFKQFAEKHLGKRLYRKCAKWLPHWWLSARGVFIALRQQLDETKSLGRPPDSTPPLQNEADLIVHALEQLTDDGMKEMVNSTNIHGGGGGKFSHLLASTPTAQNYVWLGLLEMATRLYDPMVPAPTMKEIRGRNESIATKGGGEENTPKKLMTRGFLGLHTWLIHAFRNGKGDVAPGNGIDDSDGSQRSGFALGVEGDKPLRLIIAPEGIWKKPRPAPE